MSDAFLSDARSTIRRASATAPSSTGSAPSVRAFFRTGVRRLGRPARIGVGSGRSSESATGTELSGSIESVVSNVGLHGGRDQVADRLAGGDPIPYVGR